MSLFRMVEGTGHFSQTVWAKTKLVGCGYVHYKVFIEDWGIIATLGLHLGFSAKLRIWQLSACKMKPRSGTIITH